MSYTAFHFGLVCIARSLLLVRIGTYRNAVIVPICKNPPFHTQFVHELFTGVVKVMEHQFNIVVYVMLRPDEFV